jgi:hypothetical protein
MKPEILDRLDSDRVLEYISHVRDIPSMFLLSDEEVGAIRDQRNKQQQMQQQLAMVEQGSKAAKNLGADKQGDSSAK